MNRYEIQFHISTFSERVRSASLLFCDANAYLSTDDYSLILSTYQTELNAIERSEALKNKSIVPKSVRPRSKLGARILYVHHTYQRHMRGDFIGKDDLVLALILIMLNCLFQILDHMSSRISRRSSRDHTMRNTEIHIFICLATHTLVILDYINLYPKARLNQSSVSGSRDCIIVHLRLYLQSLPFAQEVMPDLGKCEDSFWRPSWIISPSQYIMLWDMPDKLWHESLPRTAAQVSFEAWLGSQWIVGNNVSQVSTICKCIIPSICLWHQCAVRDEQLSWTVVLGVFVSGMSISTLNVMNYGPMDFLCTMTAFDMFGARDGMTTFNIGRSDLEFWNEISQILREEIRQIVIAVKLFLGHNDGNIITSLLRNRGENADNYDEMVLRKPSPQLQTIFKLCVAFWLSACFNVLIDKKAFQAFDDFCTNPSAESVFGFLGDCSAIKLGVQILGLWKAEATARYNLRPDDKECSE